MPNVTGMRLDLAESKLQGVGVEPGKIKIDGGGTFGVVVKSNWHVCAQAPASGGAVRSTPRLTVGRTCETGTPTASTSTSQQPTPQSSTPTTAAGGVDASAMETAYLRHLADNGISSIRSMCDASYTHWSCFYDGVTDGPGFLRVSLTTDGGWSEADLDTMAKQAGLAWFNFIGCDFPDLTTIVVTINGLDHNIFRGESGADAAC